jgi:hypothetical protein
MDALESERTDNKAQFDAACLHSAKDARVELLSEFNSLARRFRQYETEGEWARLVLEGARAFAHQLGLFVLENGVLHLRGQVNLELPDMLAFPIEGAAAFQSVCATKDPVTALRHPAEVTEALSVAAKMERAHLLPIMNGARVAAILFAGGSKDQDLNGLEFIAGLASSVLERPSNVTRHAQIAVLPQSAAPSLLIEKKLFSDPAGPPNLSTFGEKECLLHIRARRFSRVAVAELQLAKPDACRAAREQGSLYVFLAKEIDRSREIFRRQFMTIPSMADYLHMELVQTAVEGDVSKLGADYPGPLL